MVIDVLTETVIQRPLDAVADYAIDPGHAPEWYANIISAKWETPPPLAIGSRLAFVARFLGRRLDYTYEIVVLQPRERLVMRTAPEGTAGVGVRTPLTCGLGGRSRRQA